MRKPLSKPAKRAPLGSAVTRILPALGAFGVTLLAGPVNAGITLPTDPLTTGVRVAPNVLFILDNSGSMKYTTLPDSVPATTGPNVATSAYTRNAIYYNPSITYQPWTLADGSLMTGGTSYSSAYSDEVFVPYTGTGPGGTGTITTNSGTTNLQNDVQTFYVPKCVNLADGDATSCLDSNTAAGETYYAVGANYYRYQILTNGAIYRSEYLTYGASRKLTTDGTYGCSTNTNTNNLGWRNCVKGTPTGRLEAGEKTNFATWYSYHRTRYKAAKAGASAAFAELDMDSNVRVGFRTIWNDTNIPTTNSRANMPTPAVPIPVGYNNGLFTDTGTTISPKAYNNRTQWYNRLFTTTGSGTTPLRRSLTDAGEYFSGSGSTGAYGPESGADQLACRQNFTILTTDGYWNETYNNSTIGDADGSVGSTITGPTGSYTYRPVAPYTGGLASDNSPTLADVAMHYWRNDLRTDAGMENIVPSSAKDPAFWQHMVTFTIGLGLVGTVDQNSVEAVLANGNATVNGAAGWPTPANNKISAVDDLLHAAVNGRGTYVAASNPTAFASGLKAALAAVTERTGSFSNISANSASLSTGSMLFQASYVSGIWTGEVAAYPVNAQGASAAPSWRASQGIPTTNRRLFTSDGSQLLSFPGSITATQRTALTRTGGANVYPVTGDDNASYLAGNRSSEIAQGGILRNRNTLLGDVVGSSPFYSAETNALYVGANDGMLHAFNASTGAELFGFVPSGINWSKLGAVSRPDYGHDFFVDGPVVVSTRAQASGRNILVGALGKGGKGLFALDVTTPASPTFKWELGGSDGDVGLVQSAPIIAQLNDGTNALIVSNGINSSNGRAVLLIYNLSTGALIKKLDTEVGSAVTDHADSNGLSAPVGWDGDGDGRVDYVYAGDMLGNVWKFDLSSSVSSGWGYSRIFSASYVNSSGTVVRQPITGGLTVAMHPTTYKTWLFFGTGRLMTTGDMSNADVQSLYGITDDGTTLVRNGSGANLTQRSAVVVGTSGGKLVRAFETNAALPVDSKGWYLDLVVPPNATAEGERVVSAAQILGGRQTVMVTSSVIPTASACQSDGRGYINALDAFTGTGLSSAFFDTNGDGSFADEVLTAADGQKVPIGSVDLGVGMGTLPNLMSGGSSSTGTTPPGMMCETGSSGRLVCVPYDDIRNLGRVSWREIKRGD